MIRILSMGHTLIYFRLYSIVCYAGGCNTLLRPVFTGVERSFSTMNRIFSRLRQRLTDSPLSQLMLIAQEEPEILSQQDLSDVVYIWHNQSPRRIQLPKMKLLIVDE